MTTPTEATSSSISRKQRRMGPAPFASFEDLSDELDSPEDKAESIIRLPGIREDVSTPGSVVSVVMNPATTPLSLQTPSTPRIDISRASSSSHHDSRDSSPENIFAESGEDAATNKLGLGFREDGAMDLRSSTEELDFMDPNVAQAEKEKLVQQQEKRSKSPLLFKYDDRTRKDSQCSDVVLLSISGRTSRISSVGSQGSNTSRLSAVSGVSGISRSPSPHKMLLETSFCGPKPIETSTVAVEMDQPATDLLEQVLLARKRDPTEAVLAEGIHVANKTSSRLTANAHSTRQIVKPKRQVPPQQQVQKSQQQQQQQQPVAKNPVEQSVVPKASCSEPKNVIIEPKKTQYATSNNSKQTKSKPELIPSAQNGKSSSDYIRIKLKPDHMYEDNQTEIQKPVTLNLNETNKKSAQHFSQIIQNEDANKISRHPDQDGAKREGRVQSRLPSHSTANTPNASPKPARHAALRDLGSRTPSPSPVNISRKSSFCSLFKSRETIASPESPTGHKRKGLTSILKDAGDNMRDRSRSRSKSRDRERTMSQTNTPTGKQKSMFTIFKPKKNGAKSKSASPVEPEFIPNLEGINKVEFKFSEDQRQKPKERLRYYDTPLEGDTIRIPLHTPTQEEERRLEIHPCRTPNETKITITVSSESDIRKEKLKPKPLPKPKTYRIEYPDGSIRIPLHSPSEDQTYDLEINNPSEDIAPGIEPNGIAVRPVEIKEVEIQKIPITEIIPPPDISPPDIPPEVPPPTPVAIEVPVQLEEHISVMPSVTTAGSSNKKHILFTTKIGSRDQIFSTQLSLTKTESQSSQFSSDRMQESIAELKHDDVLSPENITEPDVMSDIPIEIEEPTVHRETSQEVSQSIDMNGKLKSAKETTVVKTTTGKIAGRESVISMEEIDRYSSESERDSEVDYARKKRVMAELDIDHESKGLVLQDSFEDELPYIPTTLPQERSVALPILPIKQRANYEIKTCPVERPRSTTPINPSCLEEYCMDETPSPKEKLKISLPREDSSERPLKSKSPRRLANASSSKTWFEFAEQGISRRKNSIGQEEVELAPPLPPRKTQWINFEDIPERRKPPKRIQTIPSRGTIEVPDSVKQLADVVYNFVNPEDCKCECHDSGKPGTEEQEDLQPLLDEQEGAMDRIKVDVGNTGDRRSIVSDSSLEYSNSADHTESNQHHLGKPFNMDLDLGAHSNRSSIISQDEVSPTNEYACQKS